MERDCAALLIPLFLFDFNSHAHVERDIAVEIYCEPEDDFNSHAHVERDVSANHVCWAEKNFNSHAHVERDELPVESYLKYQDFNSHAHVERDENSVVAFQPICISTHTLTWSVTSYKTGELSENIFQLTRSRGA